MQRDIKSTQRSKIYPSLLYLPYFLSGAADSRNNGDLLFAQCHHGELNANHGVSHQIPAKFISAKLPDYPDVIFRIFRTLQVRRRVSDSKEIDKH